jgi:hypothetical protein
MRLAELPDRLHELDLPRTLHQIDQSPDTSPRPLSGKNLRVLLVRHTAVDPLPEAPERLIYSLFLFLVVLDPLVKDSGELGRVDRNAVGGRSKGGAGRSSSGRRRRKIDAEGELLK